MNSFTNVWFDVLLGVILLLHILPHFIKNQTICHILGLCNLLAHVGAVVCLWLVSGTLEEMLVVMLGSAMVALALGYIEERGTNK